MNKNFINQFLKKIEEYEEISIFVHIQPDFDAYASAFSLSSWLKENYKNKKIYLVIPKNTFTENEKILFNYTEKFPSVSMIKNSLAIVVDTPIRKRILTQKHNYCKEIIQIDHHPKIESFAQLEFIDPTYPATSQIIAEMFFYLEKIKSKIFNSVCAQYLYSGILTDTNNLMSLNTMPETYNIISKLILKGINRSDVHKSIFLKSLREKLFNNYVLWKSRMTSNGLIYSVITNRTIKKYKAENMPNIVNNLGNILNAEIWCTLIYDKATKKWKCSIRSKSLQLVHIAINFGGGGHKNICAITFKKKMDFYKLLYTLDLYLHMNGFSGTSRKTKFKNNFLFLFLTFILQYSVKNKYLN